MTAHGSDREPAVSRARIVIDADYGFSRIDPLPAETELDRFYESQYRDLIGNGRRGPDLSRLLEPGPDADTERAWLAWTVYADVIDAVETAARDGAPRIALDVGCGTGDLVRALADAGWDAHGTEPSPGIAAAARSAGLQVEVAGAAAYLAAWRASGRPKFGAITLLNVLEHVVDPVDLIRTIRPALASGGRLVVRVPNDFNRLQLAAQRALGGPPWWVVVPDHINYFSHASLRRLIEGLGFEVLDQLGDFPMELFLLSGEDYRNDPLVGAAVHARRRAMELALDTDTRRAMGRAWAAAGIGRNTFVVARPSPG
jgi:SAM-dependent methyltransferase